MYADEYLVIKSITEDSFIINFLLLMKVHKLQK